MKDISNEFLDLVKSKILTSLEYTSKEEEAELEFHYEIQEGQKAIHYFGAYHRNNPDHPMFAQIRNEMDKFKPDIAYVEGIRALKIQTLEKLDRIKREPAENFIKDGEAWFTAKLAIDKDIPVESPEPEFRDEFEYVSAQGFKSEDVFGYYMFRVVYQYQTHFKSNKDFGLDHFKKYIKPYFERLMETAGWDQETKSKLESDFWNKLDLNDNFYYSSISDPIPRKGKEISHIHNVARQSSLFRDRYIVERIARGLMKYNRLFIVYGSAHAVAQEPALNELLGGGE